MSPIETGSFVRSRDERDDPEMLYVVIEAGIETVSGLCHKIALPETPERTMYRLEGLLDPTDPFTVEIQIDVDAEGVHAAQERVSRHFRAADPTGQIEYRITAVFDENGERVD